MATRTSCTGKGRQRPGGKLKTQKGILITHRTVPGANHFFSGKVDELMSECGDYLDRRLNGELVPEPAAKRIR